MDQEKVTKVARKVIAALQPLTDEERSKVLATVTALYGSGA